MFHEDGIEVYLRPIGTKDGNLKNAELIVNDTDQADGGRQRKCIALVQKEGVEVVVKTAQTLQTAESLTTGIFDIRQIDGKNVRERVYNSFVSWNGHNQGGLSIYRISRTQPGVAPEKPHQHTARIPYAAEGSLVVQIKRTKPVTASQSRKLVRQGARKVNRAVRSFDRDAPLSQKDKPSTHELCYRVDLPGPLGIPYIFEFQYRPEDEISQAASSSTVPIQDPSDNDSENAAHDPLSFRSEAITRMSQTNSTGDKQLKSRAAEPMFCDCPDPAHNKRLGTKAAPKADKPKSASRNTQQKRRRSTTDDNDDGAEDITPSEQEATPKEKGDATQTRACSKCKNLKVPRKKREAYLADWRRRNVKNDGIDNATSSVDKAEAPKAGLNVGRDRQTAAPVGLATNGPVLDAVPETDISRNDSAGNENTISKAHLTAVEAMAMHDAGSTIDHQPQPASLTRSKSQQAAPDSAAVNDNATRQTEHQSNSGTPPSVGDGTTRKRAADQLLEERPRKLQRIDVDLTADNDDELVLIKSEERNKTEDQTQTTSLGMFDADKHRVKKKLALVRMKLEEARLKREEAELEEQLETLEDKRAATGTVKTEQPIKLEE